MNKNILYPILIVVVLLSGILAAISFAFWHQEIQYNLPTPLPVDYCPIPKGKTILFSALKSSPDKPVFLHFFNPDCPCSKFNSKHVKYLINTYFKQVTFKIIVSSKHQVEAAAAVFDKNVEIIADINGILAKKCGVYSTPQAVILTSTKQLFYQGNYNKARYCTNKKSNYAENALLALLNKNSTYFPFSGRAYGCTIFNIN